MSISHTESSTSKASEPPSHLYLLSEQRDQDGATHHHESTEWGQGKHWPHWAEWRPTVLKKEEVPPFWRWRNWGTGSLNISWNRQTWASNPCSAPCLCSFNPRRQSYFLNLGLWGLQGPRNAPPITPSLVELWSFISFFWVPSWRRSKAEKCSWRAVMGDPPKNEDTKGSQWLHWPHKP